MTIKHFLLTIAFLVAIVATLLCVVNLENGEGFQIASGVGAIVCICLYLNIKKEEKENPDFK